MKTIDGQSITGTEFDTNNKTRGGVEHDQEEYSVKLIIGSILGVATAIVLIIFLAKNYTTNTPLSHKGMFLIQANCAKYFVQQYLMIFGESFKQCQNIPSDILQHSVPTKRILHGPALLLRY